MPGIDVQHSMSPVRTMTHRYYRPSAKARTAAVMALLYESNEEDLHITLIKRTSHPKDQHSGQISFPGGGLDESDKSLVDCALRETFEETGINREEIQVLGSLSPLYVYASNNMVYPYVGYYRGIPTFDPEPTEVEQIINVPLTYMMRPEIVSTTELQVRGFTLPEVPYYDVNGHVLWGATAMMMAELLSLWKEIRV